MPEETPNKVEDECKGTKIGAYWEVTSLGWHILHFYVKMARRGKPLEAEYIWPYTSPPPFASDVFRGLDRGIRQLFRRVSFKEKTYRPILEEQIAKLFANEK